MEELQTGQSEGVHSAGSPEHINEMLAKVANPATTTISSVSVKPSLLILDLDIFIYIQ